MGKTGFYLYGTKGKVGNLVARRGRKGTILAARKFTIKNPRTNKQMAQRIILATVAQAAKFLSPIVDHSFEGVAIGQLSKERFRKLNMNRLRKVAANDFATEATGLTARAYTTTKNVEALIPNSYIISQGSLSNSKLAVVANGHNTTFDIIFPNCSIPLVVATAGSEKITLGDAIKQIFGLAGVNEQLTFVAIQKTGENYKYAYNDDPDTPGMMIPYTGMVARRMFLDPSVDLSKNIAADVSVIAEEIEAAFNASVKTDQEITKALRDYIEDNFDSEITGASLNMMSTGYFDYTNFNSGALASAAALGYVYALGIIRSKLKEDNTWQLSNTTMVLGETTADGDSNFGIYWNGAIAAWFEGSTVADDGMYLEAGTDENTIGESFT